MSCGRDQNTILHDYDYGLKVRLTTEELNDRDEKVSADVTQITVTERDSTKHPGDEQDHASRRKHHRRHL